MHRSVSSLTLGSYGTAIWWCFSTSWKAKHRGARSLPASFGTSAGPARSTPRRDGSGSFRDVMFALSTEHPVYGVVEDATSHWERPRAWYVRIADIPGFIRHVAPVLEGRLVGSDAAGHTGELSIGFIDYGVDLSFDNGRIARVERRRNPARGDSWLDRGSSDALFPGLTFLQLLFGFRSSEELEYAFPDCEIRSPTARVVLDVLFPKSPSHLWAIW